MWEVNVVTAMIGAQVRRNEWFGGFSGAPWRRNPHKDVTANMIFSFLADAKFSLSRHFGVASANSGPLNIFSTY